MMNITGRLATALTIAAVFLAYILILDRVLPREPETPQVYAFWFLAFTGGPFLCGFLLDAIFGTRVRWWRWHYAPLAVAFAGFGILGWVAAQGRDPDPNVERLFKYHAADVVFFVFPAFVLIPTALSTVGVGARRLLGIWVAHDRARQRELHQRMSASRRPGSGGVGRDG